MTEPYLLHGSVTLYLGDCRDILPSLARADLVLTDPPYGIGEHGGAARTRGKKRPNHEARGWDTKRPDQKVFDMLMNAAPHQIIFGGNYFADLLPPGRCWFYWRKLMGGDFADGELAWTSLDGVVKEYTRPKKGAGYSIHPTQKPIDLMAWCIQMAMKKIPVTSVLDPYAGSGSTLCAARRMGIQAIGIEKEEAYCEAIAKRLSKPDKAGGFFS